MWTLDKLKHAQLRVPLATAGGLVVSVLFGLLIGGASFSTLKQLGFALLVVVYALFWQQHTWKVALAVCLISLTHIGFGFRLSTIELSGMVAVILVGLTWWRKQHLPRPPVMTLFSFRIFNLSLLAWLGYSLGHGIYTVMDPFHPYDFALKNFLKTEVGMTGPLVLLFYFIHRPRGIIANKNMLGAVIYISLIALMANILIRLWGMVHGIYNLELAAEFGDEGGYFIIPGFDLTEDPYALRLITPFTATCCAVVIGSKWASRQSALFLGIVGLVLLLSFVGAGLSGGRATIIFVFFLTAAALWVHRHYRVVLGVFGAAALIVLVLNLAPDILRIAPPMLQRSLQMVVFTEESEFARVSISDSSSWRLELFQRAIAEWRSDSRIFWFGRGTYKFDTEDLIARQRNAFEGNMDISLRRGATHSLLTDLLVIYGVCGLVIYSVMSFSMLRFLWRVYRHEDSDEVAKMVTLICLLLLIFNFAYGIVGGATFPINVTWLLIALFGYLYGCAQNAAMNKIGRQRQGDFRLKAVPARASVPVLSNGRRVAPTGRVPR